MGEQVGEDKKPRGKKYKEKVDRPKPQKKDKRKSLEDPDQSRGSDKEEEEEMTPSVGGSLVNFQENIYVLTGGTGKTDPAVYNLLLSTDWLLLQITSPENSCWTRP